MKSILTLMIFIFFSISIFARSEPVVVGFSIINEASTTIGLTEIKMLQTKLSSLAVKYPNLIAKVHRNGFHKIVIRPMQVGETGGAVLAEVLESPNVIVIYESYFSVGKDNKILESLPFSVADVALLHELIHAFDINNELLKNNLPVIGWGFAQELPADAFSISLLPQIANKWVNTYEISKIKNDLSPLLKEQGPWQIYVSARERVKKMGYPTIYSIFGGPRESFAELAAYIAIDPEASDYIRPQTVEWFEKNILN